MVSSTSQEPPDRPALPASRRACTLSSKTSPWIPADTPTSQVTTWEPAEDATSQRCRRQGIWWTPGPVQPPISTTAPLRASPLPRWATTGSADACRCRWNPPVSPSRQIHAPLTLANRNCLLGHKRCAECRAESPVTN